MSFKAVLQDAFELHLLSHLDNTMQHQLWHVPAACLLRSWCFKQMQETIEIFFSPKLGIKEQQSLAKIPDTLVCAMEFITLPTSATQEAAFATLRSATMRLHPELKVGDGGPTLGRCAAVTWWGLTDMALATKPNVPAALKRQPGDPCRALSQGSHHMSTTDH